MKLPRYLLGICLLVFAMQASSEESMYEIVFTSLCVSDQGTGFNWKNRRWERADFNVGERRWIIQKVKVNQHKPVGDRLYCQDEVDRRERNSSFSVRFQGATSLYKRRGISRDACYLINEFGEEASSQSFDASEICLEKIRMASDESLSVHRVGCDTLLDGEFIFQPSGGFRYSYVHTDFDSVYRDSLIIEVGKCSLVGGSAKVEMPE